MLDHEILNHLRNRWVVLTVFIVLFPVAYEIHEWMTQEELLDIPTTTGYFVTAVIGFYLALTRWEDQ